MKLDWAFWGAVAFLVWALVVAGAIAEAVLT